MVEGAMADFHCKSFDLDMPAENQRGFCALRYRSGKMICTECETGKAAAKEDAADVRAGLPTTGGQGVRKSTAMTSAIEIKKSKKKEAGMASKKECSKGCGKGAVKDDLCTKHYKEKHGKAPFPSGRKETKPRKINQKKASKGKRGDRISEKSNGSGASGQENMISDSQPNLEELGRLALILIASGAVPASKFEQARKVMKELVR